jgi:putative Ca2+/H+ antiporter (TMEM165/GDT1 family)
MTHFIQEITLATLLILILILLANPLGLWMPDKFLMAVVAIFAVVFLIFAAFIWKESASDERETLHRAMADRYAFLVGAGLLAISIIMQSINHATNLWFVLVLGAMIFVKIAGIIFSKIKN